MCSSDLIPTSVGMAKWPYYRQSRVATFGKIRLGRKLLSLRCGFGFLDGSRGAAAAVHAQELQGVLIEILVAGVKYGDFIFLLKQVHFLWLDCRFQFNGLSSCKYFSYFI